VEATILLCDAAEAVNGKLYILGGGWSVTGPALSPSALAVKLDVPWTHANRKIPVLIELVDGDGQPFTVQDPLGEPQPVRVGVEVEVGRPPGLLPGTPLDATLAFNIPPLPLVPSTRYAWRLTVDGETKEHWRASFTTRGGL
jgi:Family of unknown function (DUF6941)